MISRKVIREQVTTARGLEVTVMRELMLLDWDLQTKGTWKLLSIVLHYMLVNLHVCLSLSLFCCGRIGLGNFYLQYYCSILYLLFYIVTFRMLLS